MAGSDQQKQLLTLIRDFAAEKSQEERRVGNHKKEIQELQLELDAAYLELDESKRLKESIEQELKGYEVELAVNDASIQTLEVRISSIQDEVSTVGSDLEALKNEEAALRDKFIGKMFELNADIRKFQQTIASAFHEANDAGMSVDEVDLIHDNSEVAEEARRALENKLSHIISQTNKEEQEYQSEQDIHMQVRSWSLYFKDASVRMSALSEWCGKIVGVSAEACLLPTPIYHLPRSISSVLERTRLFHSQFTDVVKCKQIKGLEELAL